MRSAGAMVRGSLWHCFQQVAPPRSGHALLEARLAAAAAAMGIAMAGLPSRSSGRKASAGCSEKVDRLARWRDRWDSGQLGWHLDEVNPYLRRFLKELLRDTKAADWVNTMGPRLLVPLCGKTVDMAFLAAQGCRVVGVEGVPKAIQEFAKEHSLIGSTEAVDLPGEVDPGFCAHAMPVAGDGTCRPPPVLIIEGDFLALTPAECEALIPFEAALDRGSLVALPPAERPAYVRILANMLKPGGRVLLVAVEHDAFSDGRLGPPFEVTEADVRTLFGEKFGVELLLREDRFEHDEGMRARGVSRLHECVYILTRHAS